METTQNVYKLRTVTMTVTMFPYGNEFRVKYTKTANDRNDSRLLSHLDETHETEAGATKAFEAIDSVCRATHDLHWRKA